LPAWRGILAGERAEQPGQGAGCQHGLHRRQEARAFI
jgi:hypothetical protein